MSRPYTIPWNGEDFCGECDQLEDVAEIYTQRGYEEPLCRPCWNILVGEDPEP